MSRWKHLPASMDPRLRHLVVQLRRAKDHSGLGMQALAVRTGYSRASWDRYLNGRSLPPREAVDAFAAACAVDRDRLLALYDVAVAGASETAGASPESEVPCRDVDLGEASAGRVQPPRVRRGVAVAAAVATAVAVVAVSLVVLALTGVLGGGGDGGGGGGGGGAGANGATASGTSAEGSAAGAGGRGIFVFQAGRDHPCRIRRGNDGLLYAGYSTTRTGLIGKGSTQWAVVEAQCLLRRHGLSPGIADGMFGSHTERAVERLQARAHIVVDGVVGEDTWAVLRR